MGAPKYPKYKDSGVEWLGEMPEHWEAKPLKHAVRYWTSNVDKKSVEGQGPVSLCNYTDVYYNDAIKDGMNFMSATATPDQVEKFSLKAGDTLITKDSETADDIAVAAYVPEDLPGVICGYHLGMMRPFAGTYGSFIKWLFDSSYIKAKVAVRANGLTRVGLGQDAITSLELPLPPNTEQKQIATFLARETSKIDALVAEQKRLIELLKEKRQAVISHAVTKGLNPNAPMKPSNIPWLGDVPEHWEIWTTSHLFRAGKGKNGAMLTKEFLAENPGDFPVYSGQTENDGLMGTWHDHEFNFENQKVLFSTTVGAKAMSLKCLTGKFSLSQNCMIMWSNSEEVDIDFCYYHFNPLFLHERSQIPEHMQASFRIEDFYSYRFALPPLSEQREVAQHLTEQEETTKALIDESAEVIRLLQERRTALISAAVTGKIDVRNAVPEAV